MLQFVSAGNVRVDLGDLTDLVLSIAHRGVLEPVRYYKIGDQAILWDGNRRLRSVAIINALHAKRQEIPDVSALGLYNHLKSLGLLDDVCFSMAAIPSITGPVENVPSTESLPPANSAQRIEYQLLSAAAGLRKPLNALEEANALRQLLEEGWSLEQVGAVIGKSDSYVSRRSRLPELHPDFQKALAEGKIAPRTAECLLTLDPRATQNENVRKSLIAARTFRAVNQRVEAANASLDLEGEDFSAESIDEDPLLLVTREEARLRLREAVDAIEKLKGAYVRADIKPDLTGIKEAIHWLLDS
ncbi:MAG: hypothetical protein M0R06_14545 [Sphaerochaeta sp.]|nr:hypothetical protein [Sphaerochaeta sp.]